MVANGVVDVLLSLGADVLLDGGCELGLVVLLPESFLADVVATGVLRLTLGGTSLNRFTGGRTGGK